MAPGLIVNLGISDSDTMLLAKGWSSGVGSFIMSDFEGALEQAQRHVAIGESLVAEQRSILDELKMDGHPTRDAERLLSTLEETLRLMREHLAHEREKAGKSS